MPNVAFRAATSNDASVELLVNAQAGSEEALNCLLERYLPRLRRWARGRYPNRLRTMIDSGDLAQDAIIAALPRLKSLEVRTDRAFWNFLTRSVRNRIIDMRRRDARRPRRDELPDNLASPVREIPGDGCDLEEQFDLYERALDALTADERRAVVHRIEMQLSFRELAIELGKPTEDAARMAFSRAVTRLAREIQRLRGM